MGDEVWETSRTHPVFPWPCEDCRARVRARIAEWFRTGAHRKLRLGAVPSDPDFEAVVTMGHCLSELMRQYPAGVPQRGIELTFQLSSQPNEFAYWREKTGQMNLAG